MKKDDESMFCALIRDNLESFIARTFATVNPGAEYLDNWHIDLIASKLEDVTAGKIKRLIINVPPRYLKSVCVSVAWPAWLLGNNPARRIMVASYSQILSLKHSLDTRLVMESDWYRALFEETRIVGDQNEKFKFVTTERGFRFATSVGGTATGEGGDFLIVDDAHNPLQAASDVQRQAALDWFDQTFMSRLNDKKNGAVVVVMQRLHVNDLTGHLLEKGGWEHLCLPIVSDGKLLHEEREGQAEIEQVKLDLGSYAFAAQYMQNPVAQEGGMVELEWFGRFDLEVDFSFNPSPQSSPQTGRGNNMDKIIQSWDTAIKAGKANDYSVCTTWKEAEDGYYLLDVLQKKMEYPALKKAVIRLADEFEPEVILVEDKASGQSLLQDLRRETKLPLIAINPTQDKASRFAAVTALIEAGKVFLPKRASWLGDYEAQMLGFPNSAHDDMVDSTSQFLNWVRNKKKYSPQMRRI